MSARTEYKLPSVAVKHVDHSEQIEDDWNPSKPSENEVLVNTSAVTRDTRVEATKKDLRAGFIMPERPDYYKAVTKNLNVLDTLKKYGMQSGFRLPFAATENKDSLDELEAIQIKNLKLRGEVEENRTAINELKEHGDQAAIDIRVTQSLIDAKLLQLKRELGNDVIEQHSYEKRQRKLAQLNKDLSEYYERNRTRLLDLDKRKDRVNALQEKVYLAKKRLKEWRSKSENKESFLNLIMGHLEHDDKNATELENKQTELGTANKELRLELETAAMITTKLSEQYTRLCIEFKREYKDRKEMVTMWSATIEAMKEKDMGIKEISDEFCDLRGRIREAELSMKEEEKVAFELEWNLRQSDVDQNHLDRRNADLRLEIMRLKDKLLNAKHEVLAGKVIIQQTSIASQGVLQSASKANAREKYFLRKIKRIEQQLEPLRKRVKDVVDGTTTVVSFLAKLDEELKQEEKLYNQHTREVEKMRKFHWERMNDKTSMLEQIGRSEGRQNRFKSSISLLQIKEFEHMASLAKTQSQIYKLDLELSQVETRISRLLNDSINPEYFKLNAVLTGLREMEKDAIKEKDFIQKEVHIVRDFAFRYKREIELYTKKQSSLQTMGETINLAAKRQERCLAVFTNEKTALSIQLSMHQVRLRTLSKEYKLNRGKVLSIAQRRATMQWAVLERKSEIKFAVDMFIKQRKELRGHTAKRRLAVSSIYSFIEKLKGRFELVTRLMSHRSDLNGEESMEFQIHKLARERETLTGETKRWESRLTEASQEVEGLTNCVLIMRNSNNAFRDNLAVAAQSSEEAQAVEALMKSQKQSIVIRNRCQKAGSVLKQTIDALQKQIDVTKQETVDLIQLLDHKERDTSTKAIEHRRLKDRIHRWTHLLSKKMQELKGKATEEFLKTASWELKYQLIASKFQRALEQLETTVSENPRLKEIVYAYLEEHNMMRDFERAQQAAAIRASSSFFASTPSLRKSTHSDAPRMLEKSALSKVRPILPPTTKSPTSVISKQRSSHSVRHSAGRVNVPRFRGPNQSTAKKVFDAFD